MMGKHSTKNLNDSFRGKPGVFGFRTVKHVSKIVKIHANNAKI